MFSFTSQSIDLKRMQALHTLITLPICYRPVAVHEATRRLCRREWRSGRGQAGELNLDRFLEVPRVTLWMFRVQGRGTPAPMCTIKKTR